MFDRRRALRHVFVQWHAHARLWHRVRAKAATCRTRSLRTCLHRWAVLRARGVARAETMRQLRELASLPADERRRRQQALGLTAANTSTASVFDRTIHTPKAGGGGGRRGGGGGGGGGGGSSDGGDDDYSDDFDGDGGDDDGGTSVFSLSTARNGDVRVPATPAPMLSLSMIPTTTAPRRFGGTSASAGGPVRAVHSPNRRSVARVPHDRASDGFDDRAVVEPPLPAVPVRRVRRRPLPRTIGPIAPVTTLIRWRNLTAVRCHVPYAVYAVTPLTS
jgi:hypothetical protein